MPTKPDEYTEATKQPSSGLGFGARDDLVLVDAKTIGRTLGSARRKVWKGYKHGLKRRRTDRPQKIVVYNMKNAARVVPMGATKPTKAALRRWALKIGSRLDERSDINLVDYYLNNVAFIEGGRPSVERLSRDFYGMTLKALGISEQDVMGKSKLALEHNRIVRAQRENPESLLNTQQLVAGLKRLEQKAVDALKRSRKLSRLEAK
jgi:hypothetical protein